MFDLIMLKLTGKARDVVKVSIYSCPNLSATNLPIAVFDKLKDPFSELLYSNFPPKDFYSTIPSADEDVMDYLICLNKSICVLLMASRLQATVSDPAPLSTDHPTIEPGVQLVMAMFSKVLSLCNP